MRESPFAVRGIIEGFYGKPWSHEQRLDMMEFIGRHDMNTFVYAPKDDRLLRRDWREPYAGDDLDHVSELIAGCGKNGLDFVFCLSPGLSIEYSSEPDLVSLLSKFESISELGVHSFGLFLDDIPARLMHPSDREQFSDLVEAQTTFVNSVCARLTSIAATKTHIFVCPTQYCGFGTEDYIRRFGRSLDKDVELLWTGRAICSPTLDRADAETFAKSTGRPPTYWDNYPVNDVAMTHELHVGPYRGRDPQLHKASNGIIANGMELFESSKIPFATIADYLGDPENYDPDASWHRAVTEVAGADAAAYALFADNVRTSCLSPEDSPLLQYALDTFAFESVYGDAEHAADDLDDLAARMLSAANILLQGPVDNTQLVNEARQWIESFERGAIAVQRIVTLYREGQLISDGPRELMPLLKGIREDRLRVFGDLLEMTLAELIGVPAGGA